ncbi:hypothetical protein BS47DRAFT_591314 [Hydnum rufescens UP504]|uniref:Uncharacterized protein n=1 Tax=Hydnum rufescens UP504 TaxID=1448309 RepID=A0A9P6B3I3_9AGAM|nr:hypothetical protein BS47DRAFT_591314 [Hydnum rufescens UP504]
MVHLQVTLTAYFVACNAYSASPRSQQETPNGSGLAEIRSPLAVDFHCDAGIVQRSPNHPGVFPLVYGSNEVFLLRPVTLKDSHPVRYLSERGWELALLLAFGLTLKPTNLDHLYRLYRHIHRQSVWQIS